MEKTTIRCYICRKTMGQVHLNSEKYFEVWYDFCIECTELMRYDMERQMVNLPSKPLHELKNPHNLRLLKGSKL